MSECYSKVFIENGRLKDHTLFDPAKVFEGEVVYEVIRIRSGIPMFLDDHFERLKNSVIATGKTLLVGYDTLKQEIVSLINESDINNGNVKINLNYDGGNTSYLLYFVDARYPDQDMYESGVTGILYFAERRNPTAKVFNHKLRSSIYSRLMEASAYEAMLVNRKGCITEGSRSNLFFIRDDVIVTAPDDCVLGGITRKKILSIIREDNIDIEMRCLHIGELTKVKSAFLTGTSPNLLPFSRVGEYEFNTNNEILRIINRRFMKLIDDYLKNFSF